MGGHYHQLFNRRYRHGVRAGPAGSGGAGAQRPQRRSGGRCGDWCRGLPGDFPAAHPLSGSPAVDAGGLLYRGFALSLFVPKDFLAIAFDSGGVTTGPMTVPFIMALGLGVASIRSDENAAQDSFGLVALCSIGPILAVLILALVYPASGAYTPAEVPAVTDTRALWSLFAVGFSKVFSRGGGMSCAHRCKEIT